MAVKTGNTGHGHPEKCLTKLDRGSSGIDREFPSPSGSAQHQLEPSANKTTKPRSNRQALIGGEYILADRYDNNNQVASARWELIQAVHRKIPAFAERLRKEVYPTYANLAGKRSDYWETGWKFSTWLHHSDGNNEITPLLLAWAGAFNLEKDTWILEGALQTLYIWHKFADARHSLDLQGFRPNVCGQILIGDGEHRFSFEDWGWDPQLSSWLGYGAGVRKRFETQLRAYEKRIRALVQGRGGQHVVPRYSVEHLEWLALYHCGGWSLDRILKCSPYAGGKTTISKGLHKAAHLAHLKVRTKRGKLKSP
jgi:hypothetical protein